MNKKTLFCKETSPLPSPDFPEAPWPPAHVAATPTPPTLSSVERAPPPAEAPANTKGSASFPSSSKCKPCTEPQSLNDAPLSGADPGVPRPDAQPFPQDQLTQGVQCALAGEQTPSPDIPCQGRKEQGNLLYVL